MKLLLLMLSLVVCTLCKKHGQDPRSCKDCHAHGKKRGLIGGVLGAIFGGPKPAAPGEDKKCGKEALCAAMDGVEALITKQTEVMAAQGKGLQGRLDAVETKILDLEKVGKKLTDLMKMHEEKLKKQQDSVKTGEIKFKNQLQQMADKLNAKVGKYQARLESMEEKKKTLLEKISQQETKVATIQSEGLKVLTGLEGQEKKLTDLIVGKIGKLRTQFPVPDGKIEELKAKLTKISKTVTEREAKLTAVKTARMSVKSKMMEFGAKLNDLEIKRTDFGKKLGGLEGELDEAMKADVALISEMEASETKMIGALEQGKMAAQLIEDTGLKIKGLSEFNVARKEKLGAQMQKISDIAMMGGKVLGQMKVHAATLDKAEAVLANPPPPPPG